MASTALLGGRGPSCLPVPHVWHRGQCVTASRALALVLWLRLTSKRISVTSSCVWNVHGGLGLRVDSVSLSNFVSSCTKKLFQPMAFLFLWPKCVCQSTVAKEVKLVKLQVCLWMKNPPPPPRPLVLLRVGVSRDLQTSFELWAVRSLSQLLSSAPRGGWQPQAVDA